MSTPTKLQEHLDNLAFFTDRQDRIEALIGLADSYKHKDAAIVPRDESCKVPGCESEVYVSTSSNGTGLEFRYAVDNPQGVSAMAMAVILEDSLSGIPKEDILAVSEEVVFEIFGRELSMGKNLGLTNMIRISKQIAINQL
jgi:cysteine desulfuration protein SufE